MLNVIKGFLGIITSFILSLFYLFLPIVSPETTNETSKIKNEVNEIYGDTIKDLSVIYDWYDSTSNNNQYNIYATTVKDNIQIEINSTNLSLNTYVGEYWKNWIESEATNICKDVLDGHSFKINISMYVAKTKILPGEKVLSYEEYFQEYGVSNVNIVCELNCKYSDMDKRLLFELLTKLNESSIIFDGIRITFDDGYIIVNRKNIPKHFEQMEFELKSK